MFHNKLQLNIHTNMNIHIARPFDYVFLSVVLVCGLGMGFLFMCDVVNFVVVGGISDQNLRIDSTFKFTCASQKIIC